MRVQTRTPLDTIAGRVRERLRDDGAVADPAGTAAVVREEVRRFAEQALGSDSRLVDDEAATERQVLARITGFGALQPLLDDDSIEEIWINAPTRVFVARAGVPELTPLVLSDAEVRDLVERMLQSSGRRVDLSTPFVDASLPDGSRLHVVIPDVTRRHWAVNIRKFSRRIRDLDHLVDLGSLPLQAAKFLRMSVRAGLSIVVSGATHTGKTTMLDALLSAARASDRIVTIEETFELDPAGRDVVAMQCRQPSLEGSGEITLRRLIKEALRMRPDRLVVGEVREAECLDLLIALNSGVPGMCSIHANSAREALVKLCTLPLLAGRNIDAAFVVPTVATSVDLVVHLEVLPSGARRVVEILAPGGRHSGMVIEASSVFALEDGVLTATGGQPAHLGKYRSAGLDPLRILVGAP
ncbi:CpaF family protein [Clavibacter capsici]|uniref:CpaF family protein n=1 Tax=Clavibacter capsici TaxID=1874630 RepID=UPI0014288659|nr:ATPase, T2SS/T4P/T4SS family [Clavibacter capsici]QIS41748.1 CpaF family protein [Clavibacter capsici]